MAFEDAAQKYSLSPDGQAGGDLGTFARGVMPQSFDETCFALKPGEVSRVVASPYGFHVFKVIEHHPARELTLADVRGAVEAKLRRVKEWDAQLVHVATLRRSAAVVVKEEKLAQVM